MKQKETIWEACRWRGGHEREAQGVSGDVTLPKQGVKARRLWKCLIIMYVAFSAVNMVVAQSNLELNLEDASSGRTAGEFWKALKERSHNGIGIGNQSLSFFNSTFYNNVDEGVIKSKGGFEIPLFYNFSPVMVDFAYFYNYFDVTDASFYPNYIDKSVGMGGCEFFLSYAPLLPDFGKASEIIVPYVGLGYLTSSIKVKSKDGVSEDDKAKTVASLGVNSPMWKAGVLLLVTRGFFIRGEYKQSLSIGKPEALSRWSICAGISL